jgi:BirA family biotin operon repressor/biotin-[acetyl-CoA-carboxylase] ligase
VKQALFGKEIIHLSNIDSTNNFAAKLLSQNLCQNGAVIMADVQTQGKGQRGNIWLSESGKNLLCSFVFKPDNLSVENQIALTWATSLSLLQTLRNFNIEALIKWPNDIFVGGKKIAGILIENQLQGSKISCSIIGIGLNINQTFFEDLNATSLLLETNQIVEPRTFLNLLANEMNEQFELIYSSNFELLKSEYEANLFQMNELSSYEDEFGEFIGKIIGSTNEGKILIEKSNAIQSYGLKEVVFLRK